MKYSRNSAIVWSTFQSVLDKQSAARVLQFSLTYASICFSVETATLSIVNQLFYLVALSRVRSLFAIIYPLKRKAFNNKVDDMTNISNPLLRIIPRQFSIIRLPEKECNCITKSIICPRVITSKRSKLFHNAILLKSWSSWLQTPKTDLHQQDQKPAPFGLLLSLTPCSLDL